ncbi:hypothetical protein FB567DRAFT_596821 [Paraphoma chrysanthemicola]|uniref:SET domain-containing protein n=1 Tax=Paraphoma chrysanthemicola TaxID=798071 RepID=A0A8K0VUW2_9PLEO|nr:hypothetical protein FB567DRAFT_596821 [Paraphoma chrysanthemicola]
MATEPSPAEERKSEIVDLTEGISDADVESEADNDGGDDDTKSKEAPRTGKKKRKGRRGGKKTKKGKELEKARKLEEALHDVVASDGHAPRSLTLSDGDIFATGHIFQSHDSLDPSVDVPVLPHHAVRPIPTSTSGETKTALFATKPLPTGTRIIRERALIYLPYPGDDPIKLISAFQALPATEQKAILSLNAVAPTKSPFLTYIGAVIMSSAAYLLTIRNKPRHTRTPAEQAKLETDGAKLASTALLARVMSRWHAGRCCLVDLTDIDIASLPAGTPITGLFIDTARLGQSCMPNCFAHIDSQTGEMMIQTVRDVAIGEKLSISAMRNAYYQTASQRKAELADKYTIDCTCAACIPAPDDTGLFVTQEELRQKAFAHIMQLSGVLNKILNGLDPSDDKAYWEQAPDLEALNAATKTIHGLINTLVELGGEANPEQLRWYNHLIIRIQPHAIAQLYDSEKLGYWSYIRTQAGKAEALTRLVYGADSSEYAEIRRRKQALDDVVAAEEERKEMIRRGRENLGMERKEWEIVGVVKM